MSASDVDAGFANARWTERAVPNTLHPIPSAIVPPAEHIRGQVREESAPLRAIRRGFDILVAALGLLALLPVLCLVTVAIRLDSSGPAIFRQARVGRDNRVFTIFKFRTMVVGAELAQRELERCNESIGGVLFKICDDPRVTRLGAMLRRLNIDEIPQLFNVLVGDMSIVGPRPLPLRDSEILVALNPDDYRVRLSVRPGITGEWQVRRTVVSDISNMLELDIRYTQIRSIRHDLFLLVMTVLEVLKAIISVLTDGLRRFLNADTRTPSDSDAVSAAEQPVPDARRTVRF